METLRSFFERHKILVANLIPLSLVGGFVNIWVGVAIGVGALFYLIRTGRHNSIVLLFFFTLILGDTRNHNLLYNVHLKQIFLIIIAVYSIWEIRVGKYNIQRLYLLFIPFLVVSFLALLFSPILELGLQKTISFALFYFVGLHYVFHRFKEHRMVLFQDIMIFSHLFLLVGLVLLPVFPELVSYGGIRFNGLLGNPNGLGLFCLMVIPYTVYVFDRNPSISKGYRNVAWALIFISLAMCSSRNSLISVGIFFSLFYALRKSTYRSLIFGMVIVPLLAVFFYTVDLAELVQALGLERYLRLKEFSSGSGRVHAWAHAIELIRQNPVIGCGFSCEEYYFIFKLNYQLYITGHQGGVHNSYLAYIINTGFVGATLFFGYLGVLTLRLRPLKFIIPTVVAFAVSAMFESWLFSSLNPFHIYVVCLIAYLTLERQSFQLLESQLESRELNSKIAYIG